MIDMKIICRRNNYYNKDDNNKKKKNNNNKKKNKKVTTRTTATATTTCSSVLPSYGSLRLKEAILELRGEMSSLRFLTWSSQGLSSCFSPPLLGGIYDPQLCQWLRANSQACVPHLSINLGCKVTSWILPHDFVSGKKSSIKLPKNNLSNVSKVSKQNIHSNSQNMPSHWSFRLGKIEKR